MVPVGLVWQNFLARHDKPVLHDRDQSHPTLAGSYLAACVFLAVLLKRNPVGVESGPTSLDKQDMAMLQAAAWQHSSKPPNSTTTKGNVRPWPRRRQRSFVKTIRPYGNPDLRYTGFQHVAAQTSDRPSHVHDRVAAIEIVRRNVATRHAANWARLAWLA